MVSATCNAYATGGETDLAATCGAGAEGLLTHRHALVRGCFGFGPLNTHAFGTPVRELLPTAIQFSKNMKSWIVVGADAVNDQRCVVVFC